MTQYLTRLLAELFATSARPACRPARPGLEGLEGRLSPAALTPGGYAPLDYNLSQTADRTIIIAGGRTGQTATIPIDPQKAAVPGISIAPQTSAQAAAVDAVFAGH
jgi:hypothetical protein